MKASSSHFAYKVCLVKEMKEFVDAFYSDMSNKICSIREVQKRKISQIKAQRKYLTKRAASAKYCKDNPDSILSSSDTEIACSEKR